MITHLNVISNRAKKLRETAKEMKERNVILKDEVIKELYLEIECYADEIECRVKLIRNGRK